MPQYAVDAVYTVVYHFYQFTEVPCHSLMLIKYFIAKNLLGDESVKIS